MNIICFDTTPLTNVFDEIQSLVKTANYESVLNQLKTSTPAGARSTHPETNESDPIQPHISSSNRQLFRDRANASEKHESSGRVVAPFKDLLFSVTPREALFRPGEDLADVNHDDLGLSEETVRELVDRIGDATIDKLKINQE